MDIDSMVKSMMTIKQMPLDKLNQQKQTLQWQRESYREMNSKFYDFKSNKLFKYQLDSEMNTQKAVTSGNTDAVKAEATADANGIPMTVSVSKLATQTSVSTVGLGQGYTTTQTLAGVQAKSENDLAKTETYGSNNYTLDVNGKAFSFKGTTSLSTVISTINSDSKANVTANFDEVTGKLIIKSKNYGVYDVGVKEGKVNVTGTSSLLNLFNGVEIKPEQTVPGVNAGVNAEVYINNVKMTPSSNTLLINGVQLTFLATTPFTGLDANSLPVDSNPVTITTQTDVDKALSTIKSFVSDYNDLIKVLNDKVEEEKYRTFLPLTDEQKKEMKENEITAWESKAKSGLLKNDDILKSTISSLRETIITKMGSLSSIGITTGKYHENGKLYIDESKLKLVLQNSPQQVMELFQGSTGNQGIFSKMAGTMDKSLDAFATRAGTSKFSGDINSIFKEESVMGKRMIDYNKRISNLQSRLEDMETRYYKQFSAMETAMSKYESMSSSLTGYLQ
jgi:flagellar hook-associated protein 2